MTATQIVVIALITAAFAAGWLLRKDPAQKSPSSHEMEPEALRALLDAYAEAALPGAGALARAELARRITEAEDECDRLLAESGEDSAAVQAYDRMLNAVVSLRRLLTDPASGALALRLRETELTAARDAWQQLPRD
jgi:hypothetical protein